MQVLFDESGTDHRVGEGLVDDGATVLTEFLERPDRDDPITRYRDGGGVGRGRLHRDHPARGEHRRCGGCHRPIVAAHAAKL